MISGIIALAGAALGAVLTYVFNERSARREETARFRRDLRAVRRNVYGAFLTSLAELRRGELDRYDRRLYARDSEAAQTARAESSRLRSAAQGALSQVQLVTDSAELRAAAENALNETGELHAADDQDNLNTRTKRADAAVERFMRLASAEVRGGAED